MTFCSCSAMLFAGLRGSSGDPADEDVVRECEIYGKRVRVVDGEC